MVFLPRSHPTELMQGQPEEMLNFCRRSHLPKHFCAEGLESQQTATRRQKLQSKRYLTTNARAACPEHRQSLYPQAAVDGSVSLFSVVDREDIIQ
jgi:hypothetical protein